MRMHCRKSFREPPLRREHNCARIVLRVIFAFLLPVLFFAGAISASGATSDTVQQPQRRLVRVGFFPYEGYHTIEPSGTRSGYEYDYLQYMKRYAAWDYAYSDTSREWCDMFGMLERKEIDLLGSVRKTPEREARFAFSSRPIGASALILTVRAGNDRFPSGEYAKWNGMRVGMIAENSRNDVFAKFAASNGFLYKPVYYKSTDLMIDDLLNGRKIDAALTINARTLRNEWIYEQFESAPFYFVTRKEDAALLREVNYAVEQLDASSPELQSYLRKKYYSTDDGVQIPLTQSDRKFINEAKAAQHVYHAILMPDRYPVSYYDPATGEYAGLLKELADEIIKRSGLTIEFLPIKTRDEYYNAIADSNIEVDFIFDTAFSLNDAEAMQYILSVPYYAANVSLLRHKSSGNEIRKLAAVKGSALHKLTKKYMPSGVEIVFFKTYAETIQSVKEGRCDATYLYTRTAEQTIHDDPHARVVSDHMPLAQIEFSVAARVSNDAELASIINAAAVSLGENFVNRVRMKYVPALTDTYTIERFLQAYWIWAVIIPLSIIGLMTAFLWHILRSRKRDYRMGILIRSLPFRYFVVTEDGEIVHYSLGPKSGILPENMTRIDDVPEKSVVETMRAKIKEVIEVGVTQPVEFRLGTACRTALVSRLPDSMFGKPTAIWISQDTTELFKSREKARRNEEFFRLTLNSVGDGVITTDAAGNVVLLNPIAERLLGVDVASCIGRPHEDIFKIVSALDDTPMPSPLRKALSVGAIVELSNHTDLLAHDGQRYHIADSAAPIRNSEGTIIGVILVFRDVTETYRQRAELRSALVNWEVAAEMANLVQFTLDTKTFKVDYNERFRVFWPMNDSVAVRAAEWVYPDDLESFMRHYQAVVDGKCDQSTVTYRAIKKGEMRYYRQYWHRDPDSPGILSGLIQDLTELMQAQNKQRAIGTLWEMAVNAIPVLLFIKDVDDDFRYVRCNSMFATLVGCTVDQVIGKNDAELFNRPEDMEQFRTRDQESVDKGTTPEFYESVQGANGTMYHFRTVKFVHVDEQGRRLLIGMSVDETLAIEQNKSLKKFNEQLILGSTLTRSASFMVNAKTMMCQTDIGSAMLAEFWPMEDQVLMRPEAWVFADDVRAVRATLEDLYNNKVMVANLFFRTDFFGKRRYYKASLQCERDADNVPILTGALQDVSEMAEFSEKLEENAALWRAIIDALPMTFFVKDANNDYRYVLSNKANDEFLGVAPGEAIGKRLEDLAEGTNAAFAHQDLLVDDLAIERHLPEDGSVAKHMLRFMDKNGIVHDYEQTSILYQGKIGQRLVASVVFDASKREELLRMQEFSTACLQLMLSGEGDAQIVNDLLEKVRAYFHADSAVVLRFSEKEHAAEAISVAYAPDVGSYHVPKLIRFTPDEAWYGDLLFNRSIVFPNVAAELTKNPSIVSDRERREMKSFYGHGIRAKDKLHASINIMYINKHHTLTENDLMLLKSIAHFFEILLERRFARDKLYAAVEQAQAADKAKSYFLASMSHEIRTPLNAVIGFSELLKNGALAPEMQTEYLENIYFAGNALLQLVNDILDLSKLEADQMEITPEATDVPRFCHDIGRIFEHNAEDKNLVLKFDIGVMPYVYLDQQRVRQILFNLIGNSLKFTHTGSIAVTANFIENTPSKGTLVMKVIDTGIGIAQDDIKRLFDAFVQLSKMRGTNTTNNGTGLGLAIVKKLITKMGGTITAESKLGKGTTFIITLPNLNYSKDHARTGGLGVEYEAAPIPAQSVLIVDDVAMNIKVLTALLRHLNINPLVAHTGKEALDIIEKSKPNVVLTDLWMPEMNGEELAQAIRENKTLAHMQIVAVTAENDKGKFNAAIFDRVLEKPVKLEQLRTLIATRGTQL